MTEEDDFTPLPKYEDGEVKLSVRSAAKISVRLSC